MIKTTAYTHGTAVRPLEIKKTVNESIFYIRLEKSFTYENSTDSSLVSLNNQYTSSDKGQIYITTQSNPIYIIKSDNVNSNSINPGDHAVENTPIEYVINSLQLPQGVNYARSIFISSILFLTMIGMIYFVAANIESSFLVYFLSTMFVLIAIAVSSFILESRGTGWRSELKIASSQKTSTGDFDDEDAQLFREIEEQILTVLDEE